MIASINDLILQIDFFDAPTNSFKDKLNFTYTAKAWSEMKAFALSLQFSPWSPFAKDLTERNKLKTILANMGDAPVLPDGSQNGVATSGAALSAISGYKIALQNIRTTLTETYNFSTELAAVW